MTPYQLQATKRAKPDITHPKDLEATFYIRRGSKFPLTLQIFQSYCQKTQNLTTATDINKYKQQTNKSTTFFTSKTSCDFIPINSIT